MERAPYLDDRWLPFTPDEDVAAFAVMECTGEMTVDGEIVYQTTQPTTTGGDVFLINGPVAVGANDYGPCVKATDKPAWALYDTGLTPPVAGEGWGPTLDSWVLVPSDDGYVCVSDADTSNGVVLVLRKRARVRRAELAADYFPGDATVAFTFEDQEEGGDYTAHFPTTHRHGPGRIGNVDPEHAGTMCTVTYNQKTEHWEVIGDQFRKIGIGKAKDQIASNVVGTIEIWEENYTTSLPDDSTLTAEMRNWGNDQVEVGELVIWFYDGHEDKFYFFKS